MQIDGRKRRLAYNTFSSLLFQVTTIICGFILPRLILTAFGSDVNGLVNSITQFLGIISFLELGVGAVVQSSLYKPLAEHDEDQVSRVIKSANRFFRTIARILLAYVVFLVIFYPMFAKQQFGHAYTATLIIVISISSFAQYYFGIVNRLLLTADQHGYVQYNAQTVAIILNTAACFILIKLGCGIQMVKLTTSLIYLLQPIVIYLYVRKHYHINHKITYAEEPIKQKWNGIAQHIASVILDGTDIVVLTMFASLSAVSIYSVYFLVVKGVKQLFLSMTNGIQSLMGELWANGAEKDLKNLFGWTEWMIHTGTIFVFGVAAITIVPFVQVYTKGVMDADYVQPLFAFLLVMANAGHCLRLPYNLMILAAGHYKQTQSNYIVAAVLNIVISILTVKYYGLIGVAIGTLIAMAYQTVWMALYDSRNLIKWPFKNFLKQVAVDFLTLVVMIVLTQKVQVAALNYIAWALYAVIVSIASVMVVTIVNMVFYKTNTERILKGVTGMVSRWLDLAAFRITGGGYRKEVIFASLSSVFPSLLDGCVAQRKIYIVKGRCAYAF